MRLTRDTSDYRVSYDERSKRALTIVFGSAASYAPGGQIEEFSNTLSTFDTSIVFVVDKLSSWFTSLESEEMWLDLLTLANSFEHVVTIGESMGGCGALAAQRRIPKVERTIAISAQFSLTRPFIDFDLRYLPIAQQITRHPSVDFANVATPAKSVLLFGNHEWRDYIHSAMFRRCGYDPIYVDGADHNTGRFLKCLPGNALIRLTTCLLDFTAKFDTAVVRELLADNVTDQGMLPSRSFASESQSHNIALQDELRIRYTQETGNELGENVAIRRSATQSSISRWSRKPTVHEDAAGAVTGTLTGFYSFHTDEELRPWWSVDLEHSFIVQEIRLYNFMAEEAIMARAARFTLLASLDGHAWQAVYRRDSKIGFGGTDGKPFIWRPGKQLILRHLMVEVEGPTYLHLDQVQVFGFQTTVA